MKATDIKEGRKGEEGSEGDRGGCQPLLQSARSHNSPALANPTIKPSKAKWPSRNNCPVTVEWQRGSRKFLLSPREHRSPPRSWPHIKACVIYVPWLRHKVWTIAGGRFCMALNSLLVTSRSSSSVICFLLHLGTTPNIFSFLLLFLHRRRKTTSFFSSQPLGSFFTMPVFESRFMRD